MSIKMLSLIVLSAASLAACSKPAATPEAVATPEAAAVDAAPAPDAAAKDRGDRGGGDVHP